MERLFFVKNFKNGELYAHIKRLFSFLKESEVKKGYLALSVFLSLCFTLFTLYSVSLLMPLSEGIIKGSFDNVKNVSILGSIVSAHPNVFDTSTKLFLVLVAWVYLTILLKNGLYYLSVLANQFQSRVATSKLRDLLIRKCLTYEKSFYDKNSISFLRRILTQSTTIFEGQFTILQQLFIQGCLLFVYTVLMLRISWKLTLASFIIFPIINFTTKKVVSKIKQASLLYTKMAAKLDERIFNILYGMPIIKGYAKESVEFQKFSEASREEINQSFKIQKLQALITPIEDISTTTGILFVAFCMALFVHVDHSITASGALVFFYIAMKIIPTFNAINEFEAKVAGAAGAIQDIEYVLHQSNSFMIESGQKECGSLKNGIEIKNLSFTFDGNENPTLQGVSCCIEAGKKTAIVGPSGSGKSTLLNVLLRFYDCPPNTIFFDGVDIREYKISSVRERMSFVGQESVLFNESLMHNIQYGRKEHLNDEHLKNLTHKVHLKELVGRMPEGYNTTVGERGLKLSGGEKQRVSIARALAKEPEIIFFDEATSALDSKTEESISNFMYETYKDKTMVIIAHRLSTIKNADKIIYIEKGKVVEQGTLDELVQLKGQFYKQWEIQRV